MDEQQTKRFNDGLKIAERILNIALEIARTELEEQAVPKNVPSGPETFIKEGDLPNGI